MLRHVATFDNHELNDTSSNVTKCVSCVSYGPKAYTLQMPPGRPATKFSLWMFLPINSCMSKMLKKG